MAGNNCSCSYRLLVTHTHCQSTEHTVTRRTKRRFRLKSQNRALRSARFWLARPSAPPVRPPTRPSAHVSHAPCQTNVDKQTDRRIVRYRCSFCCACLPHFTAHCRQAVVKYCNEHVCVCVRVCLSVYVSASISLEPHAWSLPIFVHVSYRRGLVLLRRGDAIPMVRTILGVFFPIDNALYIIAYVTHAKTAEPIEMPFGIMIRVGPGYHVLDGTRSPNGKGQFWGKT